MLTTKSKVDNDHIVIMDEKWISKDSFQSNGSTSFSRIIREEDLRPFIISYLENEVKINPLTGQLGINELLNLFTNSDQIDKMLELFKGHRVSLDIATDLISLIVNKQYALQSVKPSAKLEVFCELELSYITIPDPQKDEIVFSLLLNTGTNVELFRNYVIENRIIPKNKLESYVKKWKETGMNDGLQETEKLLLEKVLRLEFMEGFDTELQYIAYNYEENSGNPMVWRVCAFNTHVRIPLDFNDYPFDHHFLSFYLLSPETFDVTDQQLIANEADSTQSLHTNQLIPPRSFKLKSRSKGLMEISNISRLDFSPESMIRFDLEFARISSTFLWHTFIPSAVISILSLMATGFVLFSSISYLEAVLTQVIPSVLIAIAALQLVAAQNVPQNSGHTWQDNLFVIYYVSLLILYASMQLNISPISQLLFLVTAGMLLTTLFFTAIKIHKNR